MAKMYYLIRVNEDGSVRDYVTDFNSNNETFSTMNNARHMKLMTEKNVCKYYGMGMLDEYVICEMELDNRVELFVEFKPLVEPQPEADKVIVKE